MPYLRIKLPAAQMLEIDSDKLIGFDIAQDDDTGEYKLCSFINGGIVFVLCTGTFDKCHMMLNKIHNTLDLQVVDI